ncbi:hypothetical protein ACIOKD_38080 [Streptomyces sp. NPDC087844]|uniref:hypothetical protein n=1 Tax=Streptomyces sp. NPDC087844 TaxID=3365805 RepID=UPI003800F21B
MKAEGAEGAGLYEQHLERQAQALRRLKVERGDPPLRRIQARARELFGDGVPLPPATQHAAFNGRYVSLDKLIVLVRTLMSWDAYGQPCPAPDRTHPDLAPWHEQWRTIAELRSRRHRPAPTRTPTSAPAPAPALAGLRPADPDDSQDSPPEPAAVPLAPPAASEALSPSVSTPHPPAEPGHFATRALAKSGRALAATSLAGVLILALDASSPRLCTAAYTGGATQHSLPAEHSRQAHHPALAAGVRQRPAAQPGMCIYYVGRTGCPADFPQPTSTTTPPPSPIPYPDPDPSPDLSPSPDPSPSPTLAPKPEPTRKQNVCT